MGPDISSINIACSRFGLCFRVFLEAVTRYTAILGADDYQLAHGTGQLLAKGFCPSLGQLFLLALPILA